MDSSVELYGTPEYKRSRNAYRLECTFEYFVTLLVTDAFLAKLLSDIGLSDALIGLIASVASLAFLFQLFSIFVVQRITNTKRFAILFHTLSQLLFMSLYLIPFLPFAFAYKKILAICCILGAYFGNYFVTSIIYKWGNSHVEPHNRASFSAGKEMISLISGMIVTVIIGYIMDSFEMNNNLRGGFIFAAIAILIFSICDFVCLILIKNQVQPKVKRDVVPMKTVLKKTMGNRNFASVVLLTVVWNVALYTTTGFLAIYRIKELMFSVGAVQIINIVGNLGRFFFSKPFGRYSDKNSYAKGIKLSMIIAAIAFGINIFTTPESRYLVIVYTLLYSISLAGTHQNMMNITYSYVDSEFFVQASAIKNSIGGLCGFGASFVASKLLEYIQANGNMLFGIRVYGQQVLSLISFVLIIVCVLIVHFVIQKQKTMVQ